MADEGRVGLAAGFGAYTVWGVLPLYWKLLVGVPAAELLAHRIVWSFGLLALGVALSGRLPALVRSVDRRILATYTAAALLVGSNWLLYVWAVAHARVVEVSLGYFMNPMLSVLLGVGVLGERLARRQWVGVGLAAAGVGVLLVGSGAVPWVSFALAGTFGAYGLVKKLAPLGSIDGLLLETALLVGPSAAALAALGASGAGAFGRHGLAVDLALIGTGAATSLPLVLFGVAARRIPLSVLGLLQYVAPTLQLLLAVLWFGEPFGGARAVAFACVWGGIAVFVGRPRLR